MIRRILATTALAGALATAAGRAGLARSDQADAARLDRPAHHHPHHGRGAEEGRATTSSTSRPTTSPQFAGLKTGDLDVAMEIWETTGREAMDEATATGQVENLGETGMQAIEEWWYPAYMKEKCPGLPDWKALKEPACAEAFSTPETAPKGRYLGGPVTWGGFDEERVEALGPAVRGGPRRHRRGALRRARERLPAPGADHALDLRAALGADQVRGRVGRSSRPTSRPATPTRPGA